MPPLLRDACRNRHQPWPRGKPPHCLEALRKVMPPPLLSVCTAPLRRAHTSKTCLCSKDFAFVPGRDRGRVGWPIGLGVGCSPYPVLPATLPQAAALPAVAPALAAARQQRKCATSQRRGNERCGLRKERSRLPRRRSLDLVLNHPRRARSTTAS